MNAGQKDCRMPQMSFRLGAPEKVSRFWKFIGGESLLLIRTVSYQRTLKYFLLSVLAKSQSPSGGNCSNAKCSTVLAEKTTLSMNMMQSKEKTEQVCSGLGLCIGFYINTLS